jgi:hypothetical protein
MRPRKVGHGMSKRIILGVAGVMIFLAGILAGIIVSGGMPAFARSTTTTNAQSHSSSTPAGYCQLYEQTLASQLHVSEANLESANSAALQTVINQMAKDGQISSKQQSLLQQAVREYGTQPCSHLTQLLQLANAKNRSDGSAALQQLLSGARQSIEAPVAAAVGISTTTLNSDLAAGQTIPQIASTQHVSLSTVNKAYLGAVQTLLSQAVSNGYLTQSQSSALYSRITTAVNSGRYPLLQPGGKRTSPAA